jgi:AcrR family transcriptional regulator
MTPPRAGLTRDTVLDVATEVADREGLELVSLKAIAAAVNVRPPSLYNHVDGLEDVRVGLRLRALEQVLQSQNAAIQGLPVGEWLPALARAHRDFAARHPGLYEATHPTAHRPDEDPEVRRVSSLILETLIEAVSPFGRTEDEAIHAVRAFRSLVIGFNLLERAGHFGIPVGIDESFDYLVGLLMSGLQAPGEPAHGGATSA